MGNISIWQLIIVAVIVVLLFGTKKLRTLGSDLGHALKGFRNTLQDDIPSDKPSKKEIQADITKNVDK